MSSKYASANTLRTGRLEIPSISRVLCALAIETTIHNTTLQISIYDCVQTLSGHQQQAARLQRAAQRFALLVAGPELAGRNMELELVFQIMHYKCKWL